MELAIKYKLNTGKLVETVLKLNQDSLSDMAILTAVVHAKPETTNTVEKMFTNIKTYAKVSEEEADEILGSLLPDPDAGTVSTIDALYRC